MEPKFLIIGAGDRGANVYSSLIVENGFGEIAGVCDPEEEKLHSFRERYEVPKERCFSSAQEAFEKGVGNVAIIASPDKTHRDIALEAARRDYHILLEKPMGSTPEEVVDIAKAVEGSSKVFALAYVLRYTPFFSKLKEVIDSKEFGELLTIHHAEDVGSWHFAHSFVRGNWKRKEDSGPIILTKSCHDMDIIYWFFGDAPKHIFSQGSLDFFSKENKPEGAAERCLECPFKDCRYNAEKVYLEKETRDTYLADKILPRASLDRMKEALCSTDYGRCVWGCENNVCDSQNVVMEFEGGRRASFNLDIGPDVKREIRLYFEKGKVEGSFREGRFVKKEYPLTRKEVKEERVDTGSYFRGHGGGDIGLLRSFVEAVRKDERGKIDAPLLITSHLMSHAAEESRVESRRIDFSEYRDFHLKKGGENE